LLRAIVQTRRNNPYVPVLYHASVAEDSA
jgi:hypothetical protein